MLRTLVTLSVPLTLTSPVAADSEILSVDVYVAGHGAYHTYRIPAIVRTLQGTLLAFCEGRKQGPQDWGDIDLLVKRSTDGGLSWSDPIVVADFGADTVGNPAPVLDRTTGVVWLLMTSNPGNVREPDIQPGLSGPTRRVWVTFSKDDGRSWAPPREITAEVKLADWSWYATGPVNGIQLRNGRLVIPCDHVRGPSRPHPQRYSHVVYSDDHGTSWRLGGSVGPDCNESTVVELSDGTLMLNMRSYAGRNRRAVAVSRAGGLSWSEPWFDETLIEPVCQASLLRVDRDSRVWLLFSNPASTERVCMTVRASLDEGRSWVHSRILHAGPAAYSNLVEVNEATIGVLYERGSTHPYERISFARFPLRWLVDQ